jgi:hypothetical protein
MSVAEPILTLLYLMMATGGGLIIAALITALIGE